MFGSLGFPELVFILVLALLIFGPRKLPEVGRTLGRALGEFRRATSDLKRSLDVELSTAEYRSPPKLPERRREERADDQPEVRPDQPPEARPGTRAEPSSSAVPGSRTEQEAPAAEAPTDAAAPAGTEATGGEDALGPAGEPGAAPDPEGGSKAEPGGAERS